MLLMLVSIVDKAVAALLAVCIELFASILALLSKETVTLASAVLPPVRPLIVKMPLLADAPLKRLVCEATLVAIEVKRVFTPSLPTTPCT